MLSYLKKLLNFFKGQRSLDASDAFDVDLISQHFDVTANAKRLGALGLPAFHAKELTSLESDVLQHINTARLAANLLFTQSINGLDSLITGFERKFLLLKAESMASEFDRKARQLTDTQGAFLKSLAEDAELKTLEQRRFKTIHQIDRIPDFPQNSQLFFRYALLFALIVVEGALNAGFFAQGMDTGLIGGFVTAAVMAAINVVVSFLIGRFVVRWIFHRRWWGKLLGIIGLTGFIVFVLFMAISITHLRDALLEGVANPSEFAWITIQEKLFAIKDLYTWFLMMITAGFGMTAMIDGIFMDDRYPGYGRISRRAEQARSNFESEYEDIQQQLEDLKQDKLDSIEDHLLQVREILFEIQQCIEQKKKHHADLELKLNQSEIALFAVLRKFRFENEMGRTDGLKPNYFSTLPSFTAIAIPKIDTHIEQQLIETIETYLKTCESNLPAQIQSVYQLYDNYLEQLHHLKLT
jgi:hypothetical protein